MYSPADTPKTAVKMPLPDLKKLTRAIGQPSRWKMLRELSCGEPRSIAELASAAGVRYENAVKHLAVLRDAGLVQQGRGSLYQILPHHLPTPGAAEVDFGHCLLRLDMGE
jgi:predicted transcriptional regulator